MLKTILLEKTISCFLHLVSERANFFVLQVLLKIKSFSCNKSFFYKKNDRLNSLNSSVDLNATKSVIINLIYLNNIIKRNNIDNNQKN